MFQVEPYPAKVDCAESTSNQIVDRLFGNKMLPLQKRLTFISKWYTTICLPKVMNNKQRISSAEEGVHEFKNHVLEIKQAKGKKL